MHIRNKLEDFRVDHVPDNVMPELNSAIRYAVYDFFKNVTCAWGLSSSCMGSLHVRKLSSLTAMRGEQGADASAEPDEA